MHFNAVYCSVYSFLYVIVLMLPLGHRFFLYALVTFHQSLTGNPALYIGGKKAKFGRTFHIFVIPKLGNFSCVACYTTIRSIGVLK